MKPLWSVPLRILFQVLLPCSQPSKQDHHCPWLRRWTTWITQSIRVGQMPFIHDLRSWIGDTMWTCSRPWHFRELSRVIQIPKKWWRHNRRMVQIWNTIVTQTRHPELNIRHRHRNSGHKREVSKFWIRNMRNPWWIWFLNVARSCRTRQIGGRTITWRSTEWQFIRDISRERSHSNRSRRHKRSLNGTGKRTHCRNPTQPNPTQLKAKAYETNSITPVSSAKQPCPNLQSKFETQKGNCEWIPNLRGKNNALRKTKTKNKKGRWGGTQLAEERKNVHRRNHT